MSAMILEITFFLVIHACFQNVRIIRVYIVAGDFGMLFNCGANIPICSRLVFGPPETSNFIYFLQHM